MKLTVKEIAAFGMYGCLMFASKVLMELLPNMHLLAVLIVSATVVFRAKALYAVYVYVSILGLVYGFTTWWIPNLYTWTVLWAAAMLIPQRLSPVKLGLFCTAVAGAHGFLYGVLCAPANALLTGLNFQGMLTWIGFGLPFDLIHGVSNILLGVLIVPLIRALTVAKKHL